MVPRLTGREPSRAGLPRASGDGPASAYEYVPVVESPPRERGWSLLADDPGRDGGVSPARAGMVPSISVPSMYSFCLPRASGDGPLWRCATGSTPQSPPRERGWSRRTGSPVASSYVSPARAGMVPHPRRLALPYSGLPRASGDGPTLMRPVLNRCQSPPRERGWSLLHGENENLQHVSPARAGMVPAQPTSPPCRQCLPRASGDGPRKAMMMYIQH